MVTAWRSLCSFTSICMYAGTAAAPLGDLYDKSRTTERVRQSASSRGLLPIFSFVVIFKALVLGIFLWLGNHWEVYVSSEAH
jgi:hypothetical protein